jgi:phage terminase small subunit
MEQISRRYKLSERKRSFARFYFDFERVYLPALAGNAYRCALQAGYSESYAKRILWHMDWRELEDLMRISRNDSK